MRRVNPDLSIMRSATKAQGVELIELTADARCVNCLTVHNRAVPTPTRLPQAPGPGKADPAIREVLTVAELRRRRLT